MSFNIIQLPVFENQLKRLLKKYPSVKNDVKELAGSLKLNPQQGVSIGRGCYKIRIRITSKGKGKSGGGRVITNVLVNHTTVVLLSIYDKSEKQNISDSELKKLIDQIII